MFRFGNPEFLYLLAVLPVVAAIYVIAAFSRRRRLARFGRVETLKELMPDVSAARNNFKFILFLLAAACVIVAAARPRFGSKLREEKSKGVEMVLAIDVSNSMLAEDFEPNRLERTKYAVDKLFDGLKQERVGVVVFAGEAVVQLPVTADYRMAKAFAKRIAPSLVSVQGTAVGAALETAMMSFAGAGEGDVRSRVIVLITDGETHDNDAIAVAKQAAEAGIRIYAIGIGTPEGAPIRIDGDFIRDEKGEMVVSKLDENLLQQIASETGGAYVRASKQSIGLDEITVEINRMEQAELSALKFEEYNEQFPVALWIAFALLVLEVFVLDRKNPVLSRFDIFGRGGDTDRR